MQLETRFHGGRIGFGNVNRRNILRGFGSSARRRCRDFTLVGSVLRDFRGSSWTREQAETQDAAQDQNV